MSGLMGCTEESLHLTQEQGFGFFPGIPGQQLKDGCYEILRKLGRGGYSPTWLVSHLGDDSTRRPYQAVKILTAKATELTRRGLLHELEFLQAIMRLKETDRIIVHDELPNLRDHFFTTSPHDVKPDNVHFVLNAGVNSEVATVPPIVEGHVKLGDTDYPILRSQPFRHRYRWDDEGRVAENYDFCLNGLGHDALSQWADKPPPKELLNPLACRAPEVILGAGFDHKVDIWAVGCLVFELLTGQRLFYPSDGDTDHDLLARMQEFTGEAFSADFLGRSGARDKFFDHSGKLLRGQSLNPISIERALSDHSVLEPYDIERAAGIIRACLRLDPKKRPTACGLLGRDWVGGAVIFQDYRVPK